MYLIRRKQSLGVPVTSSCLVSFPESSLSWTRVARTVRTRLHCNHKPPISSLRSKAISWRFQTTSLWVPFSKICGVFGLRKRCLLVDGRLKKNRRFKYPGHVFRTSWLSDANYIGLVKSHSGSWASVINWQQYWLFCFGFYSSLRSCLFFVTSIP